MRRPHNGASHEQLAPFASKCGHSQNPRTREETMLRQCVHKHCRCWMENSPGEPMQLCYLHGKGTSFFFVPQKHSETSVERKCYSRLILRLTYFTHRLKNIFFIPSSKIEKRVSSDLNDAPRLLRKIYIHVPRPTSRRNSFVQVERLNNVYASNEPIFAMARSFNILL